MDGAHIFEKKIQSCNLNYTNNERMLGVVVSVMDLRPKGTEFDSRFSEKIGERLEARNKSGDWKPVRGGRLKATK